jgi:hypothetical protein
MALMIVTQTYEGDGRCNVMPGNDASKFTAAVNQALGKIREYPLGIELLEEIESADCDLRVLKAGQGQTNKCTLRQQAEGDRNEACYKEVLSLKLLGAKVQQLFSEGLLDETHPAMKKFTKFYIPGENLQHYEKMTGAFSGTVNSYPIAHKGAKTVHTTEAILRQRVSEDDPQDKITEAIGYVQWLRNGLVGYHIMSHLTQGPGTQAIVVWDPQQEDPGAGLDSSKRAAWMTRPSWIALVHELIHGWRLVSGRCVFRPDNNIEEYYEEAMTVGLPPYDGCKFTENKFRMFGGEAVRMFYGEQTRVLSEVAQKKHAVKD